MPNTANIARISHDPSNEVPPDFAGPEFASLFTGDAAAITSAIAAAAAAWKTQHEARMRAWEAQVEADAEAARIAEEARLKAESDARAAAEKAAEDERIAAEKKKPKPPAVVKGKRGDEDTYPRPSTQVEEKMRKFEYVELHNFHHDICSQTSLSTLDADRSFQLHDKGNGELGITTVHKSARKIKADKDLTWEEVTTAKTNYIYWMEQFGWPEDLVSTFATFYVKLDNHLWRQKPESQPVLVRYQAERRDKWFLDHRNGLKDMWDISCIDDDLLIKMRADLRDEETIKRMNVSNAPRGREDHSRGRARSRSASPRRGTSSWRGSSWRYDRDRARDDRDRDRTSDRDRRGDHRNRASGPAQPFRSDAHPAARGACVICLGRHDHGGAIHKCRAQFLYNTSRPTRCTRAGSNLEDVVVRLTKDVVCLHFNLQKGCSYRAAGSHPLHECSGCGSTAHNAQACPAGKDA